MGRLNKLRGVDPVLTTLARGYTNNELIADALFPFVPVPKEAGEYPEFGKEAFMLYNTERALRGKSNRMDPDALNWVPFTTKENDLEYPIDYREQNEALFNVQKHGAATVQKALMLQREYRAATLAQAVGTYGADNKIVLSGTSQFTDYDNSDPVVIVDGGKKAVRAKTGKRPNTMVMGADAFDTLKEHPKLLEKIKYSMKGVLTVELLKEIFNIKNMKVGDAVWADDKGIFHDVWSDNIILAYVPEQMSGMDRDWHEPSYGYTLRRTGYPFVDRYEEGKKLELVRNTDNYDVKVVGPDAGYLISNTNG
ncbi:MAG: major capsid protein [Proteobacteria bacterium]|nr:major capsid protein [Pseudomonadota bacterium]